MPVLRLFAAAREAAGVARVDIDGSTVSDVLEVARARYGDRFVAVLDRSRIWVNGQPAEGTTPVQGRDVVAVIPPVSGGAGERGAGGGSAGAVVDHGSRPVGPASAGRSGPEVDERLPSSRPLDLGGSDRPVVRPYRGTGNGSPATGTPTVPLDRRPPPPRPSSGAAPRPSTRQPGPERPVRAGEAGPERPVRAGEAGPERPVRAGKAGPERPVRGREAGPGSAPTAARRPAGPPPVRQQAQPAPEHTQERAAPQREPRPERPERPERPVRARRTGPERPVRAGGTGPKDRAASPKAMLESVAPTASKLAVVFTVTRPHGRLGRRGVRVLVPAAILGNEVLAGLLALTAAVGASQAVASRRSRGEHPQLATAALAAVAVPVAATAGLQPAAIALAAGAGLILAVWVFLPRHMTPGDAVTTLGIGLGLGMAAAAPVLLRDFRLDLALLLLIFASAYDAGAYLVGTGASNAWEGPAAGVVALIPVTILSAVVLVPPLSGGEPFLLGLLAAVLAPLGPLAGTALIGSSEADVPGVRRLDSLLVLAPLWAAVAWALV